MKGRKTTATKKNAGQSKHSSTYLPPRRYAAILFRIRLCCYMIQEVGLVLEYGVRIEIIVNTKNIREP